jgi:AcrR family transcriptional regulator
MSSSTRAQAKRETREALIQAGLEAFAAEGLDVPSLDAICARAGFTRGAFYVHFRDRDDFLVAVMEDVLGRFLDAVIATGDDATDLGRTLDRFADALAAAQSPPGTRGRGKAGPLGSVPLFRLIEAAARSPAIRARLVGIVGEAAARVARAARSGQSSGTVRRDVDPEIGGQLLVISALGLMGAVELGVPFDLGALRIAIGRLLGRG